MKKIILIAILFISLFSFGQSNMGSRMLLVSQAQYVNEVSFDADYQVYLDRLTTLTYTLPTAPTQVLQKYNKYKQKL